MKSLAFSKYALLGISLIGFFYFMIGFPNIFKFRDGINTYDASDVVLIYFGALLPILLLMFFRMFLNRITLRSERRPLLRKSEIWIFAVYVGIIALGGFRQIQNRPSMADIERRVQESKASLGK